MPQPDAFPAIHDLGFLSNREAMALMGANGNVEFMCLPRPDSGAVFAALLDRNAGRFQILPADEGGRVAHVGYEPGTMTLATTWETPTGSFLVRDVLCTTSTADDHRSADRRPEFGADPTLIRTITCLRGHVAVAMVCSPRPDFAREEFAWELTADGGIVGGRSIALRLGTDMSCTFEEGDGAIRATSHLRKGESAFVALAWADGRLPTTAADARARLDETGQHWQRWLSGGTFPTGETREALERSALTLEGMRYEPTGALVAAPSASLPEVLGGSRNWDYRYTWWRDASMQTVALSRLGFTDALADYLRFLVASVRVEDLPDNLLCMVRLDGSHDLEEVSLDHLAGYGARPDGSRGSQPVRIGNGAAHQRQNDVPGALLDAIHHFATVGGVIDADLWTLTTALVEAAISRWRLPDEGIWEIRGAPRHFISSKVMSWVAVDRGRRLAHDRGETELAARWQAIAGAIHDEVCRLGVNDQGVFTQYYGSGEELDASALLIPIMGFLPGEDPRVRRTVLAVADQLSDGPVVRRYRTATDIDGLGGQDEGGFILSSFWLVEALICIGEITRAQAVFTALMGKAGLFGLYAEELDHRTGAGLGNMPQGYSHLGLIQATLGLLSSAVESRPEEIEEPAA